MTEIEKSISEFFAREADNNKNAESSRRLEAPQTTIDNFKNESMKLQDKSSVLSKSANKNSSSFRESETTKKLRDNSAGVEKYWTTIMNDNRPEKVLIGVRTITVVESIVRENVTPLVVSSIQIESVVLALEDQEKNHSRAMTHHPQ